MKTYELASASEGTEKLKDLVANGWEPFAAVVYPGNGYASFHLRRCREDYAAHVAEKEKIEKAKEAAAKVAVQTTRDEEIARLSEAARNEIFGIYGKHGLRNNFPGNHNIVRAFQQFTDSLRHHETHFLASSSVRVEQSMMSSFDPPTFTLVPTVR